MGGAPDVSVVLPVYDEEGNLEELHRRLTDALCRMGVTYELVFVDDGSQDRSFELLSELAKTDPRVRALSFSRNFGHHIAITAGIDAARGEAVVLMDADLQDRPEEIPKLYAKLLEGYDVVYAIRMAKKHSLFKRVASLAFNRVMNRIVEGHEIDTAIFRIARRRVIDAVKECREQARMVLGLFSWVGFRQTGVEVTHGERHAGETKYSLVKMIRLALHTVTGFSRIPLQVASYLGLIAAVSSFAVGGYFIWLKLAYDAAVEGWTSTIVAALFLGGVQLLCLGILGEYVGRIYGESQRRPLYVVAEELGGADPRESDGEVEDAAGDDEEDEAEADDDEEDDTEARA